MLVLGRYPGQRIYLTTPEGREIVVQVIGIDKEGQIKLAFDAPREVVIEREEIREKRRERL